MKAKKEKDYSAQPPIEPLVPLFKPYTINIRDRKTLKTFEQVLNAVFSNPEDNIEKDLTSNDQSPDTEEVNKLFLTHLAYGIQGVEEYDPEVTLGKVHDCLAILEKKFPSQKEACQFFLHQFKQATQYHSAKTVDPFTPRNLERISPKNATRLLPFCQTNIVDIKSLKKIKKDKHIEAMCNDIKLLHLINFMRLHSDYIKVGKPIPANNNISSHFNQLFKLIYTDIVSSKHDQKLLRDKLKTYLAIAHNLLQDKSIIDYEGVGIINCVLQLTSDLLKDHHSLKNAIIKLSGIFNRNFKLLRESLVHNFKCIPFYSVISKDLIFIAENNFWDQIFLFGLQYHNLSSRITALREETIKQRIFYPSYQTNLCTILDGCSLFWSSSLRKENELDNLPTITCKAYILSREQLFYWDKTNNVYEEQHTKDGDLTELSMKLNVQCQLLNSARLLSSEEIKLIGSFTTNTPKEQPIETQEKTGKTPTTPRHSKRTLRHSISVTSSPTTPSDKTPHVHSAPTISSEKFAKAREERAHKRLSRKMTTNNSERKLLNMETIEEKQEDLELGMIRRKQQTETMLRKALIENGHFSVPRSKQSKRHSEPVTLKTNSENLTEQSGPTERESKLTI